MRWLILVKHSPNNDIAACEESLNSHYFAMHMQEIKKNL